jgi:hypothetical protein
MMYPAEGILWDGGDVGCMVSDVRSTMFGVRCLVCVVAFWK